MIWNEFWINLLQCLNQFWMNFELNWNKFGKDLECMERCKISVSGTTKKGEINSVHWKASWLKTSTCVYRSCAALENFQDIEIEVKEKQEFDYRDCGNIIY